MATSPKSRKKRVVTVFRPPATPSWTSSLKHLRDVIAQNGIEPHIGDDQLLMFGVQHHPAWFLQCALGPGIDFPAWRNVSGIVDAPYTDISSFRLHLIG